MALFTTRRLCSCYYNLNLIKNGVPIIRQFSAENSAFEYILVDKVGSKKNVGLIQLNRPKALNALCYPLRVELCRAIRDFDQDDRIGAIILTGNEKAFAAGADIKEMQNTTYAECINIFTDIEKHWSIIDDVNKPLIAAVNGYALGGGCELALSCDFIYAGENAKFGQPEIVIGTIPGGGGTQRLPKSIGKSKAMEMVLTGNFVTANEAEKMGLVSKVFPVSRLLEETVKVAEKISSHSPLIVRLCKASLKASYETYLTAGRDFEIAVTMGTFATKDQKEGMTAFVEKRKPDFKNE